jgi:FimV-like protein
MLRYIFLLPFIYCLNTFADLSLSSPNIKLNAQDQRVIEFRIENENIKDGDVVLYEYKTNNPIDESLIAYTLINDYVNYQTFTIVLDDEYLENYFSFKILIKENFAKDIFIYLPSKVRNTLNNSKLYKPKRILSETTFSLAKSKNVVSNEVKQTELEIQKIDFIKGSEITTVWSMAEKIKGQNQDISIYQIMWSIYLGNRKAFINDNINLIRKDIDINIPKESEMRQASYEFAKDSILEMNDTYTTRLSSASRSLLVLTAPTITESIEEALEDPVIKEKENLSLDGTLSPKDFIEKNTKDIKVGIESEVVNEFFDKVAESEEIPTKNNIEIIDLIFISLISLISGIFLALIYINLRKIKSSRNNIVYDFEEVVEDDSDNVIPSGLSVENNEDQQQLDLAMMYFEMDDKKSALNILNNIINGTDNESIKENALSLLNKIK